MADAPVTASPDVVETSGRRQRSGPDPRERARKLTLGQRVWRERWMYVLILPGLAWFLLFQYVPLLGNIAAFQNYSPYLGFRKSPWVGFTNFEHIVSDPELLNALKNTLILSFLQIIFAFPAPILLALLLNSILSTQVRRWIQSIVYLPHFIGWVIVISIWNEMLGPLGILNHLASYVGLHFDIIGNPAWFKTLVTLQVVWKGVGWGTIIFLAAMLSVPQELYESAAIDRAGPLRRIWHVTLPGITPITVLLLILTIGSVLSVGFEQILLQQPIYGADVSQTLDTFVYFRGISGGDWGLATAAQLAKGIISTILILGANKFAKRMGTGGVF